MTLIPDWRLAWRFLSVQASLLLAVLSGIQADVLPLVGPLFPADKWPWVSGGIALAIVVLRVAAQPGLEPQRFALELDALAALDEAPTGQAMPAGRLERYLGAFVLLLVGITCLSLGAVAWLVWGRA
jgi:hypothetical protein